MKSVLFACTAFAAFWTSGSAFGAALVLGEGPAQACYEAARADRNDILALRTCNSAFETALSHSDRVATSINRGIILVNRRDPEAALADFNRAISLDPESGEAYVNRGAALVLMAEYDEAILSLTRGIELASDELHKAYFNRAIAYEELGQVRNAYEDYSRAAELAPDWQMPRAELARFTVTRR